MNHLIRARSPFILFLMCAMLALTIQSPVARAAMVPTGDYLRQEQMGAERARLMDALRDEQVAAKLQQLGIPPEMVERRIQRLTSEEVALLNERIDELPAGGASIVGITIFVLVLLIVLDLLGATDIFPAIRPIQIN